MAEKHERKEGEGNSIGLILCSENKEEQIELLELDQSHIRVAEYMTQLPAKEVLAGKLNMAVSAARGNG